MKKYIFLSVFLFLSAELISQPSLWHDLYFNSLAKVWDEAIPLGNGTIGALVWQKGGRLRFALDRSDLWDQRPMKGLHRKEFSYQWVCEQVKQKNYTVVQQYFDAPYDKETAPTKISGGALEFNTQDWGEVSSVHLFLKNALCEIKWNNGVILQTFVHASKSVGWFKFSNISTSLQPELVAPKYQREDIPFDSLKSNDVAKLGYVQGKIKHSKNTITYYQQGYNGFSYQITVSWKYTDANTVEGVWSVTSNYKTESIASDKIVKIALQRSFNQDSSSHANWWKIFWSKSSIRVSDSLLEKQWYLEQYKFGSTARKAAPPILLQGVWTADNGKLPPWKGDYHHDLNTEMSYWPAYSANHLEEAMGFVNHLDANKLNYKRYTKLYFGTDGIAVPGVTTLDGTEMGGWIQYALSPTVSAWLAQHFYLQWRYGMDKNFLRSKAYPWISGVSKYLEKITYLDKNGFRKLPFSSSPEINNNNLDAWFVDNTNYDLALMKYVFSKAEELAGELGMKTMQQHWKKVYNEFESYALSANQELMYAPAFPYTQSHRHFSNAMAIHPLGLIKWDDGPESRSIINNTIHLFDSIGPVNWNGYSYAWLANLKARGKDGAGAANSLNIFAKAFCSINSFHINGDQSKMGYSGRTYRPFTLEGNFGFASGLQEMLLQSYEGCIEVMPAVPVEWKDVSFTDLRAEGAFLVTAKKESGKIISVKIVADKAGKTKLKLPFKAGYSIISKKAKILKCQNDYMDLSFDAKGIIELKAIQQ